MLRLERHTVGVPHWRTLTEVAWSTALILERNKKCRSCRQTERRMRWAYGKEGRKLTEEEGETKAPAGINWFWKELKDTSPQFQWFTALARSQRGWASATAGRNKIKWVYRSHPPPSASKIATWEQSIWRAELQWRSALSLTQYGSNKNGAEWAESHRGETFQQLHTVRGKVLQSREIMPLHAAS